MNPPRSIPKIGLSLSVLPGSRQTAAPNSADDGSSVSRIGRGCSLDLKLHRSCTATEAVAAFGPSGVAESFCDGQFVVLPGAVVCLLTVGTSIDGPHLPSPEVVVWRPQAPDAPADPRDFLPEKVRDVFDRGGPQVVKIRAHQMFLRAPADGLYAYAGEAHLGCYGSMETGDGKVGVGASFSLDSKLPRDLWLRLGGFPGWMVEVQHEPHRVADGDSAAFDRLVRKLSRRKFGHLSLTRYEGDSLSVHLNATRGWLMYLRHPADSGLYTTDPAPEGRPESEEIFRCACGIDLEFPNGRTLPRALAISIASEFFRTGQLPAGLGWAPE